MREIAKALGDNLSAYDNDLAAANQYRTTIAKKAALIVIDDVWNKGELELFLADSPRSRLLFTTRDAGIARFIGAREHRVDVLDAYQSREVLALWAGLSTEQLPPEAEEIIRECGNLPLAVSTIGALLRGAIRDEWKDTLDLLTTADLSSLASQLPPGQDSFFRTIEVSVSALVPEMQERYKALAVLLEDMAAQLPILQVLWDVDEAEARRASRLLADRSLSYRNGASGGIRLHDLQLDYVRAQYPARDALHMIHAAVRLSSHVITSDPVQFQSQIVGRINRDDSPTSVKRFVARIALGRHYPWLEPIEASLHPPGTSLLRTLETQSWLQNVSVTPDGRRALSASMEQYSASLGSGNRTAASEAGWPHEHRERGCCNSGWPSSGFHILRYDSTAMGFGDGAVDPHLERPPR
jgi:NB-ARC domain